MEKRRDEVHIEVESSRVDQGGEYGYSADTAGVGSGEQFAGCPLSLYRRVGTKRETPSTFATACFCDARTGLSLPWRG